jgi:hypothetical protein
MQAAAFVLHRKKHAVAAFTTCEMRMEWRAWNFRGIKSCNLMDQYHQAGCLL